MQTREMGLDMKTVSERGEGGKVQEGRGEETGWGGGQRVLDIPALRALRRPRQEVCHRF